MLIELPYKEGDVVSLKLTSGEEIVAKLTKEENDKVLLSKPLSVVAGPQGLALAPYMFTVSHDAKLNINSSNIVCIHKTVDEMSKQYISNTTGIAV